jgi:hypothetical protein
MRARRTATTTAPATAIPEIAAGVLHKRLLLASDSISGDTTALGGDATTLGGDATAVGPGIGFLTASGAAAVEALSTRACTFQVLNHRPWNTFNRLVLRCPPVGGEVICRWLLDMHIY